MTLAELAAWLDEEYRRVSILLSEADMTGPGVKSYELSALCGRAQILAEVAAFIRAGSLPRHQPVPAMLLWRYEANLARERREFPELTVFGEEAG